MSQKPPNETGTTQTAGEGAQSKNRGNRTQKKVENSDRDLSLDQVCQRRGK